jgi:hypothetical protein
VNALAYRIAADLVLALHFAFVAFVVLGLVLILAGGWRGWAWVRNPGFRLAHLAAIGVVVAQAWLGVLCPLTLLEVALRERAGVGSYPGSFIAYWLGRLLYVEAPPWAFTLAYTAFGLLVAAAWWRVRPRPLRRRGA